jgi:hypothetical protein
MDNSNNKFAQEIADNLNWNVLREYYEKNKNSEEFKFMSKTDIEQWFLQQVNSSRLEQNQKHITIDEIREQLKQPFGSTN